MRENSLEYILQCKNVFRKAYPDERIRLLGYGWLNDDYIIINTYYEGLEQFYVVNNEKVVGCFNTVYEARNSVK